MNAMKWTVALAAAGFAPAFALADESGAHAGNTTGEIRIVGNAVLDGGKFIIVQEDKDENKPGNPNVPGHPSNPADAHAQAHRAQEVHGGLTLTLNLVKHEKGAYLGVSASPPPAVLRKQLALSPGMGLVIDFIVPDSPASKAGLQQYDVIQKLDDQLIINPPQLAVLVRSHKPGDEIKLGIIHEGKPVTLSVSLVEHELEPLADEEQAEDPMARLHGIFPEPMVRPVPPGANPWVNIAKPNLTATSLTWLDDGHSYTIATNAQGHKTFTEKDKDGKTVFEGPIDTKEQRDNLPADQKEKLKQMEQHMGGAHKLEKESDGK